MSGVELQRRLIDANSPLPIIFVTAHGDASLRDLVMKAGAAGFLNKPVRSDALLKEIYAAIEKQNREPNEYCKEANMFSTQMPVINDDSYVSVPKRRNSLSALYRVGRNRGRKRRA